MDVSMTQSVIQSEGGASTGDMSTLAGRSDPRSPMSMGHLGASTLSMRAKAARKRHANAHHNSNFRAGYVPVHEEVLHKTGIRGRKRYLLYCTLTVLTIFALLNLAVTVWLMYILGMSHLGMTNMEITSQAGRNFIRFLAKAHITTLTMNDAPLGSRYGSNLTLEAEDAPIKVEVLNDNKTAPSLVLEGGNLTMTTDAFCIGASSSPDWGYKDLTSVALSDDIVNLKVKFVEVTDVQGFRDLYLESMDRSVAVKGHRGVDINTKKDINLKTMGLNIDSHTTTIGSKRGLLLTNLPVVTASTPIDPSLVTYKLCACANGKLFKVKVTKQGVTCAIEAKKLKKICRHNT